MQKDQKENWEWGRGVEHINRLLACFGAEGAVQGTRNRKTGVFMAT